MYLVGVELVELLFGGGELPIGIIIHMSFDFVLLQRNLLDAEQVLVQGSVVVGLLAVQDLACLIYHILTLRI